MQLGLSQSALVIWLGCRGLQWSGLMAVLFIEFQGARLDILLTHLGDNDVGLLTGKALIVQVQEDLMEIKQCWPGVVILWSAIIPRWT